MAAHARALQAAAFSPALLLLGPAAGLLVYLAVDDGGLPPTTWYPAALFALGLVVVGALSRPPSWRPSRQVVMAGTALGAYTLWSFASIAWADQRASAWDGANRTALYALLFVLFAWWRLRAPAAAFVVASWAGAVAAAGAAALVLAATVADPARYFIESRFFEPVGYQNANVALWTMAFFPCVGFAARREAPPFARVALMAGAVVLASLALMGQSRGWLFAAPLAAVVFVLLERDRARAALAFAIATVCAAIAAPAVLDVYSATSGDLDAAMSHAARWIAGAATVAAVVCGLLAWLESHRPPSRLAERRAGNVLRAVAACAVVLAIGGVMAMERSPADAIAGAWAEFKSQPTPVGGDQRLSASLGSNRYDFWRVAWNRFEASPLIGIGADNFQQDYLARRDTLSEPVYPHSFELRTLLQTGLIGTALLAVAIVCALAAALGARRNRTGIGATTAALATTVFVYWMLHGSIDWFFEFPALGGAAFALLGLAAGLRPRHPVLARRGGSPDGRPILSAAALVAAVALAASFVAPWASARDQALAAMGWADDPGGAFDRLDRARTLNPLSARPDLVAGTIALRLGLDEEAERHFRAAIARDKRNFYAHLELGAIVSQREPGAARRLLERARVLNPRDDLGERALKTVERGGAVDITEMNRALAERSRARGGE